MIIIEEYPPTKNPHRDTVSDEISILNYNLAKKSTQLAAISLCSLAGIID
jgi:hypothetical protein